MRITIEDNVLNKKYLIEDSDVTSESNIYGIVDLMRKALIVMSFEEETILNGFATFVSEEEKEDDR